MRPVISIIALIAALFTNTAFATVLDFRTEGLGGQGTVITGDEWLNIGVELSTPDTVIEVGCSGGSSACVGASVIVQDFRGRMVIRFVVPNSTTQASTLNVNIDFCCENNSGSTDSTLFDINGQVITTFTDQDVSYQGGTPVGWIEVDFGFDAINTIEFDNAVIETQEIVTFAVTKDFSDNNPTPVEIQLSCDSGLPLNQSFVISDPESSAPNFNNVTFVVKLFEDGVTNCTITETPIANYTPSYTAGGDSNSEDDNSQSPGCHFFDINFGDNNSCQIANTAKDATFTVFKEWEIFNSPGAVVFQEARVTAHCNNEITGGVLNQQTNLWSISADLGDGDSLVAVVDTTERAAQCRAEERIVQSGVESVDDCGQRTIGAGGSSSCTFTNTVFFEGIPTLNQYGLALMALLMLGIGLLGFRRLA